MTLMPQLQSQYREPHPNTRMQQHSGALLINKHPGTSSFGVIEIIQNHLIREKKISRRDLPKLGHGGTLDPFATGLLVILVGRAVKLARYFLGATKSYQGTMKFGETTVPGDPTSPVSETCPTLPKSLEELSDLAHRLTLQAYFQIPPMHSAKKKNGKPLYELARAGLEVEREPKLCHLYDFQILNYQAPIAEFKLKCSSGTYVRTLAQDFGRMLGSLALVESLHRLSSGVFHVERALDVSEVLEASRQEIPWNELPCWIPFDRLLEGYGRADVSLQEKAQLFQGKQSVLFSILKRVQFEQDDSCFAIYHNEALVGIARRDDNRWALERIFN